MERKLAGWGIRGRGREERCRGRTTSAKGQHGNGCFGSDGRKRRGAGGRVSGGWLRQGGGQMRQEAKRAASNASGCIGRGPFTSGRNEPGRTHPEQEFTL